MLSRNHECVLGLVKLLLAHEADWQDLRTGHNGH